MLENENYTILKVHICSFERKNGVLTFDRNKYPERLCVFDKINRIVIDVGTKHQYPYVRVLHMQSFYDVEEVKTLDPNKRVGCMEYATVISLELDSKTLKQCRDIIKLLNRGFIFPNGNEMLTNEEYLEVINGNKKVGKVKKIGEKRK